MTNKSEIGKKGEDLACEFLKDRGFKIIERNFRQKWDELDVVAISKDKTLVFVEVKTLRQTTAQIKIPASKQDKLIRQNENPANGNEPNSAALSIINNSELKPEDNLTSAKLKKLQRIAQLYANKHFELFNEDRGWRIDLVAITLFADQQPQINYYENI